ncbi:DUF2244 domain-containing protein [Methylobrevis pamukkalensis]|uniref:DUF2244 domain-containing protein n=1 Tax=Methylobrevis pamukkalensis TaxID=1439726 RepID=A0A1E3H8T1_9HYPH|nr:DUF2244 domain-containing protein [Methylobrevis pamukkalensis]ODN72206.1 hypothetical protein A6302_00395 [Methylobrevis pamukkalensis]
METPSPGGAASDPVDIFFAARLTPHRSLSPQGFLALMAAVGAVSFALGLFSVVKGAWPIAGFFGLDVAILWFAFRRNFADARQYEEIRLSPTELLIRRVGRRGDEQVYRFNPYWVRLDMLRLEDEGLKRLDVISHGQGLEIGAFLNPDDRESFAEAFGRALGTVRR